MRREFVRVADLGTEMAENTNEQDLQRQTNRGRRAPRQLFPCPVQAIDDGSCHGSISRPGSSIGITRRSAAANLLRVPLWLRDRNREPERRAPVRVVLRP